MNNAHLIEGIIEKNHPEMLAAFALQAENYENDDTQSQSSSGTIDIPRRSDSLESGNSFGGVRRRSLRIASKNTNAIPRQEGQKRKYTKSTKKSVQECENENRNLGVISKNRTSRTNTPSESFTPCFTTSWIDMHKQLLYWMKQVESGDVVKSELNQFFIISFDVLEKALQSRNKRPITTHKLIIRFVSGLLFLYEVTKKRGLNDCIGYFFKLIQRVMGSFIVSFNMMNSWSDAWIQVKEVFFVLISSLKNFDLANGMFELISKMSTNFNKITRNKQGRENRSFAVFVKWEISIIQNSLLKKMSELDNLEHLVIHGHDNCT